MTDNPQTFRLEQFYLAQSNAEGQAAGIQLLGHTLGVRPEHVTECRRVVSLLPPPQRSSTLPGAFGIFRGESVEYVLVKAQSGPSNTTLTQYALAQAGFLRQLSGNLHALLEFAMAPVPLEQSAEIPLLALDGIAGRDHDGQTDDLLTLLDACRNNFKSVGGLLAALVQGMGLCIVNAPSSLRDRFALVQGLLTLLPAPARIAITFATSVSDAHNNSTQIKFMNQDGPAPERHMIFDWATGKLRGEAPDDAYAKFILSQLRLDTSLVIEQTEKLARTAVWRAMRRETMATALAWASKRATLDSAVDGGMPVDRELVSAILREDPTLPDDLRVAYARHLLTLSLALNDPNFTEIVPALAAQNKEVSDAVYEHLWNATRGEHGDAVHDLVQYWINTAPMGTDVSRWRPLLGMSMLAQANGLLNEEPAKLIAFLDGLRISPPAVAMDNIITQIIALCRKRAHTDPAIAQSLIALAFTNLPLGDLQRLMTDSPLIAQTPPPFRAGVTALVPGAQRVHTPGVLALAAEAYGPEVQPVILARMVDWALTSQHPELVDVPTLHRLLILAKSSLGEKYDNLIRHAVEDLSHLNVLKTMRTDIQRYLIELSLARRHYPEGVVQLVLCQDLLYQNQRQEEANDVARTVFREVGMDARSYLEALIEVQNHPQLKASTVANAHIGALEACNWSREMEPAARYLSRLLYNDPRLIAMIDLPPALRLLKANADRRDGPETILMVTAILSYALALDATKPELIDQVYSIAAWSPQVAADALDVVKDYVRGAPLTIASTMPQLFGSKYGEPVRVALDTSFRLRLIVGGSDLDKFAEEVTIATELLQDMATYYADGREIPQIFKLQRNLQSIPGGLSAPERARLSRSLNRIGELIMRLYQLHVARVGKRLKGEPDPQKASQSKIRTMTLSGPEALNWLSGQFGESFKPAVLSLNRDAPTFLVGSRSLNMLVLETDRIVRVLSGVLAALPEGGPTEFDRAVWSNEVRILWEMLSLYKQREIQESLSRHLQFLAQLLLLIGERGNPRSLQASGIGQQLFIGRAQPRTVIDVLRWMSGYFAQEHSGN